MHLDSDDPSRPDWLSDGEWHSAVVIAYLVMAVCGAIMGGFCAWALIALGIL